MSNKGRQHITPTIAKSGPLPILAKLTLALLCALCLQPLSGCADLSSSEGIAEHAIKYATNRSLLDMSTGSVIRELPDAKVEISLVEIKDMPDGSKEIEVEPTVISDTMASWSADEWAENRVDLFFNLATHFDVICEQAPELTYMPEDYTLSCPGYMVVYDSKKDKGFIVSSTGVYQKTDDPKNPIGEAVILTKDTR